MPSFPTNEDFYAHLTTLWNFGQPQQSEERFIKAAQQAAEAHNTHHELEALTQQARAQGLQKHFDEAHKTLDAIDARLTEDLTRPTLRSKLERGRVFNSAKQPAKAQPLFLAAWQLAQQLNEDGLAVDAAHMLAIVASEKPSLAMQWNLKALKLAQSSPAKDAQKWLGSLYNNIGWTYFDQGDFTQALDTFQQGVVFREQQGKLKPLLIARWTVGRALRALGQHKEALIIQEKILKDYDSNDLEQDGYVFEEIAECSLALNLPEHKKLFQLAHQALSKDSWFRDNEAERLKRLHDLGL